ncbi:acetolactate synthase large subunit [Aureibacter tunicatorum]|uniref:Acetolactate synthase-1/2/3 large subunit n=1 Tax=Aureibacter tunicatorum TaxID=866807 RepID=A0AAE3XKS4_9BACT|nr:acetolactate synthase large subunit [Aureibacter tunicatorum]MDR6238340.1 acetolactate synthase-1/2/3 large subunit [Aureibacter tunicatorum]BDD03372.1 acetolactate synthase [Aureibacter tunicatorum]
MKASDVFIKALENEGVKYIFGIPGEETLDLLDSLIDSKISFINVRHETVAGYMAATVGRLTGMAGVCLSTIGPGAANLVPAAAYSNLGGWPMVMITGQKPVKSNPQGRFQFIRTSDMMSAVTKSSKTFYGGKNINWMTREAFKTAESERPGAVHLELPEDVAKEYVVQDYILKVKEDPAVASENSINEAVKVMTEAKKPIICLASGCNRKANQQALSKLVKQTCIPFITTQLGKGAVDERNPDYLGNACLSSNMILSNAVKAADVILVIGHDDFEKPPFKMQHDPRVIIHLNYTRANIDPEYCPTYEVIGDIANAVNRITDKLSSMKCLWEFDYFRKLKKTIDKSMLPTINADQYPLCPSRIVNDTREAMPDDGIVCLDNGMYKIWYARNYRANQPNTLLLDNALATMGAGLASAISAKLLYPQRKVIAVCGDGGFMMHCQDLETAVRLNLNLVVLILRDNAFGMIKWKQESQGLPNFSLDIGNPDFTKFAESFGAKGHFIENTEDLLPALKSALDSNGVHLIDCPIDYESDNKILKYDFKEIARNTEEGMI